MTNAFITCIYNNLYRHPQRDGTIIKGRNYRDQRYLESILIIAKTGVPVYCYTGENDFAKLTQRFAAEGVTNIHLILKELIDFPWHERIQAIKTKFPEMYAGETDLFWDQRCLELMLGKFNMIDEVIDAHPEIQNLFWIDAGLSHNDVISSPKYCLQIDLDENRLERNVCLFTPRLMDKIIDYAEGKILMAAQLNPHNTPIPAKYNKNPYVAHVGVVGGFFGGNVTDLKFVCQEFFKKADAVLADEVLYGEENIVSGVYIDTPEIFKLFGFNSWYHEGWIKQGPGWHDPEATTFSMMFDTILENDTYIDDVVFTTMAFGEKYRNLALEFINSFLKHVPDFRLFLVTDEPEFFAQYADRITIKQMLVPPRDIFPYNIKYKVISMARDHFFGVDKLVYLDADCFFIQDVTKELFAEMEPGLNVVLGSNLSVVTNNQVLIKVNALAKNAAELDLNAFRECALLFKIDNNYTFKKFLMEWELLFEEIDKLKLVHIAECNDITIAAKRAGYPINDLHRFGLYELRECIFTTVKHESIRAIL